MCPHKLSQTGFLNVNKMLKKCYRDYIIPFDNEIKDKDSQKKTKFALKCCVVHFIPKRLRSVDDI